jgi:hypothetical protein
MESEESSYTHTILPATGTTESGMTRSKVFDRKDKSEAKNKGQNKYNVIAISTQQVNSVVRKTARKAQRNT